MDAGHWNVDAIGEFDPSQFFGFIYEIEELSTGRSYIGKKFFRFKRRKTKSDSSRTKESDWRDYTSSCEPLKAAIEERGKDAFAFRILSLCVGRCQLTYEENQLQFARDVLRARLPNGERKYWNKTIGHLLFAGVEKQTEEAKRKIALATSGAGNHNFGKPRSPETRRKIGESHKGQSMDEETKAKIARAFTGRRQSPEHVQRRVASRLASLGLTKPDHPA